MNKFIFDSKCKTYRDSKTGKFCRCKLIDQSYSHPNSKNYGTLTYFPDDNCGKLMKITNT